MHLYRYDDLSKRVQVLEMEMNGTLAKLDLIPDTPRAQTTPSAHQVKARLIKESEYQQEMIDIKTELKTEAFEDIQNLESRLNHLDMKLDERNETDKQVMDLLRGIRTTYGPSIDGLTRKVSTHTVHIVYLGLC